MATDKPLTISNFLKSQILRSDYLLVEESTPDRTRFPHEQKLEYLHTLCVQNGYRSAADCEQIRRRLYTEEYDAGCPVQLQLALAYLPDNVLVLPESTTRSNEAASLARLRLAQDLPHAKADYQLSFIGWNEHHYWLYLPADVHSLLITHDCALLAA